MYVVLLEPLKSRNPMQMTVGTVLVTVGLLLILSDLAALLAGPTSSNIRLELDVFQFRASSSRPPTSTFCSASSS